MPTEKTNVPSSGTATKISLTGAQQSVAIALSILDCLAVSPELGPSAVARELGIAKSTASRTLAVMAERGVLDRRDGGRYRLGLRMFEYGQITLNRLRIVEVSVPILAHLRERVSELVQLTVPVGAEVQVLDRFEAADPDTRFHSDWRRMPAHSSSSGRAIAAFNLTAARAMLDGSRQRLTRYTTVDARRLVDILAETHRRRYATTHEEVALGISSVAAPVLVRQEKEPLAIAAVSIVCPTPLVRPDNGATLGGYARAAADRISDDLARPVKL